jgi:RecA/RadA recombinase
MDDSKSKALAAALSQIEKQYGKGSIMKMDDAAIRDIEVVSTGSLGLDLALGVGGLPRGRVVEIYGPESSGKTTLTLQVIAEMQKAGGTAAFIDAENALDISYAAKLGVKTEDLLISQPDTGEQALEIADMLVRSGAVDVIVIDSVAALTPKAEIEGEMGEPQMGLQARLMSQALRKLTGNIKRTNTLVIFINQIRMKIGVMFGNPETTTGGNALRDAGQGGEEQGGAAVPAGGVRHPVRRGHLARRRGAGARRQPRRAGEVRRLVHLQRRPARPGQGQLARLPQGKRGAGEGNRGQDPRQGRREGGGARSRRGGGRAGRQEGRAPSDPET